MSSTETIDQEDIPLSTYKELVAAIVKQAVRDRKSKDYRASALQFLYSREAQEFVECYDIPLSYIVRKIEGGE